MACTLPLAFLIIPGFISLSAASCNKYIQKGSAFTIPLNYSNLGSNEIIWKHNESIIFKRKNGVFQPGKAEDISIDGSLQLKDLTSENSGTYKADVFNSNGANIKELTFRLCVKVNEVSKEISNAIKPTAVPESGGPNELFGFDFWTMVGILAGGGGLVLLLIIITLVCCCRSRRKSQMHFEEERELRLAPLTKTQHPLHPEGQTKHPSHPEGQKQRQRPPGGAPPGSTGPRPTARASSQAAPQPRAQARGRPPQTPMDDDEEQPPPLPQPRKKGPHPSQAHSH